MSEDEAFTTFKTAARIRDHCYAIADELNKFVLCMARVHTKEYDPEKIKWASAEWQKGPFQRSEDVDNPDFKALRKDLAEHYGKLMHQGFFYWVFQNGVTIGR